MGRSKRRIKFNNVFVVLIALLLIILLINFIFRGKILETVQDNYPDEIKEEDEKNKLSFDNNKISYENTYEALGYEDFVNQLPYQEDGFRVFLVPENAPEKPIIYVDLSDKDAKAKFQTWFDQFKINKNDYILYFSEINISRSEDDHGEYDSIPDEYAL